MSVQSQFPPYAGRIVWSNKEKCWNITVRYADGSAIPAQAFFQAPVLTHHLQRKGLTTAVAALNTQHHTCEVRSTDPEVELKWRGSRILQLLQFHYFQFKGRRVIWTLERP